MTNLIVTVAIAFLIPLTVFGASAIVHDRRYRADVSRRLHR